MFQIIFSTKKRSFSEFPQCFQTHSIFLTLSLGHCILAEEGFVWTTCEIYKRCTICLKTLTNLIPCENCNQVLLCAGSCVKSELHQIECAMDLRMKHDDEVDLLMVVRSILMALHCIPNLSELIKQVNRIVCEEGAITSDSISTELSRYSAFLENGLKWQWPKEKGMCFAPITLTMIIEMVNFSVVHRKTVYGIHQTRFHWFHGKR